MFRTKIIAATIISVSSLAAAKNAHAQWSGPFNPVVGASDRYFSNGYWDPYTGRFVVRSNQHVLHASATDPYRNDVLPGSMQYVNYLERDWSGRLVRVTGWRWTSINGVPHSTLSRMVVQHSGYTVGYTPGGYVSSPIVEHQTTTHYYKMKKK